MSELGQVSDLAHSLVKEGVGVRLIAPDSAPILRMVSEEMGLQVPFLSDFWPHGAAAKYYEILDESTGRPQRVSLLVDSTGRVVDRVESSRGARDMSEHLTVLQKQK